MQLAVELKADPAQLEKWMELQERYEANQAKKAYVVAMAEFRAKCPAISRTRKAHNSMYAGLCETIGKIKGLMSECGLSHRWQTEQAEKKTSVTCVLTHIAGHSESTTLSALPDETGSKNAIQAIGSTVSYLERYTLFALLGLASMETDDDGNGAGEPDKPVSQKKMIEMLISDAWKDYCEKNDKIIGKESEITLEKFTAELRKLYGAYSKAERDAFDWTKDNIGNLVRLVSVNNVVTKKGQGNGNGAAKRQ